jgi:RNA polymerase sigma-70 factor (ECF subfamily)
VVAGPRTLDLKLADRCLNGDRVAQNELFDREKHRVHGTLYRILGPRPDLDDLAQEAFIRIFRSLRNFRGEALLATWVDRITVRVAYAHIADRKRQPPLLELVPDIPSDDPDGEQRAMDRQATRRLYEMLAELSAEQRTAFALHVLDGRPLREVAEAQKSSLIATKMRVWRVRRELERRAKQDPLLMGFVRPEGKDE